MSSKIKSPYIEDNGGDSVLIAQEFSSENDVRELTFEAETELISVSLTYSTSGNIDLGPSATDFANITTSNIDSETTVVVKNFGDDTQLVLDIGGATFSSSAGYPITGLTFSKQEFTENSTRSLDHLYNIDEDGNPTVVTYDSQLSEKDSSFGLLRTDPKLTGNVKLTVDSDEKIWLNSIDANKELADSRFKRFEVSSSTNYVHDLYKFFDNGKTPSEVVYDLFELSSSYLSTQRTLDNQYDRLYTYGAYNLNNRFYDEEMGFFAPFRMGDTLPEYFVVFRVNGPVNSFTYTSPETDWKHFVNEDILKVSDIVKTFDMTDQSELGKYIRNLYNHPSRKSSELSVSFQEDGYTTFNGISYEEGSMAQKAELLADFFAETSTQVRFEEFITLGFERNRLVSSEILNLEFLFTDADAEDYTINRYFGLFVNKNDLGKFYLSDQALEQFSLDVGQTPVPRKGIDGNKTSERTFVQGNEDGMKVFADTSSVEMENYSSKIFTTQVDSVSDAGHLYFSGEWGVNPYLSVGDTMWIGTSGSTFYLERTVSDITQGKNQALVEIDTPLTPTEALAAPTLPVSFYTEAKENALRVSMFNDSFISDKSRLFYIQDKQDNFYNVAGVGTVSTHVDTFNWRTDVQIDLNEKQADISSFTGVSEMMSQTPAKLTSGKGRSVMELEITDIFQDHDQIEISWNRGLTAEEPTRWVLEARSSFLEPGEYWPDYAIVTEPDLSKSYFGYFHPGRSGDVKSLVKSIGDLLKIFPYTIFESVYSDDKIYLRSTIQGEVSNEMSVNFTLGGPNMQVYDYDVPLGTSSVFFMGGSEYTKDRAIIDKEIAKGLNSEEYFKIHGTYLQLRGYDVFGNTVYHYTDLEDVTLDKQGEISDFPYKDTKSVIQSSVSSKGFLLTKDDQVTSYSLYKTKFGLFSIFAMKDFDFDYISSDYTKNYDAELEEFFDNVGPLKYSITTGASASTVNFFDDDGLTFSTGLSGSYTFLGVYDDGRTPDNFNGLAMLNFDLAASSEASLVYYTGPSASGDLEYAGLTGPRAPQRLVPLTFTKAMYYDENKLSKFKGFFSLSSPITDADLQRFSFQESQWNYDRFSLNSVNTEYENLQENFLKEYAFVSKVVPYICKWVSPQGKDVRDNPYRLNYSRAFGTMNFTPSDSYFTADTKNHTHEWPYLANVPKDVDVFTDPSFAFSYLFEKPEVDLYNFQSIDRDWFMAYFVVGYPSELYQVNSSWEKVLLPTSERYSVFTYDPLEEKTFTLFRGIKLEIGVRSSDDSLTNAEKYDGYKFSSIIVPVSDDNLAYHEQVESDIVVNEKFKFIVHVTKIRVSSYINLEGNTGYTSLYTMENKRDRGFYKTDPTKVDPIYTDFVYQKGIPSDVMFSSPPVFPTSSSDPVTFADSVSDLREYLNTVSTTGVYNYMYAISELADREDSYTFPPILSVESSQFYVDKFSFASGVVDGYYVLKSIFSKSQFRAWNNSYPKPWDDTWIYPYYVYYASGGDNAYSGISKRLSMYELSRTLSGNDSADVVASMTTVTSLGAVTVTTPGTDTMVIESRQPDKYIMTNFFYPVSDTDKPPELFPHETVGAKIATKYDPQFVYRYQGNFVPKFRNVLQFASREDKDFSLTYGSDFLLGHTAIVEDLTDTYYLKNQYFNKVAREEILVISPDSGYQSTYPLVNEVSIDHKDVFSWSSSWDNDYFRKYLKKNQFRDLKGTAEMREIRSFFGSKAMKLPEDFTLYEFSFSGDDPEMTMYETETNINLNVDVYEKFLRELLGTDTDEKAKREFLALSQSLPAAMTPEQVDGKTRQYIIDNILPLYEISLTYFYTLETGNQGTKPVTTPRPTIETNTEDSIEYTLSSSELLGKSYTAKNNATVVIKDDLKLVVTFNKDSRYYTSVSLGVKVKRI